MDTEKQLVEMMAQIVGQSLELAKNLKVLGDGLAETMRQVIELKERVARLESQQSAKTDEIYELTREEAEDGGLGYRKEDKNV